MKATSEQAQIKPRLPIGQELRHYLAYDTGKLEPVTRTWTGNPHPRMRPVPIDKEMPVWRVGVHAHCSGAQWAVGIGEELANDRPHRFHFLRPDFTVDGIRIDHLALVMAGDFHTVAEIRKAVEELSRPVLPDVNRAVVWPKPHRMFRLERELYLAFDGQRLFQVPQQGLNPTAGG